MDRERIPFFTDNCVPDSVGRMLSSLGHEVTYLRDCMSRQSPDALIALTTARSGQVLVSLDNDFKGISKRLQISQRQYWQHLHRIALKCEPPESASRIAEAMSLIEHEWGMSKMRDEPMVIEVGNSYIRSFR